MRFNAKNTKNIFQSNIKALCIKQNKATKTLFLETLKSNQTNKNTTKTP
ncbi:hypothetical protein HPSA20_0744 [Helicobacter pylori SouthAfrica20]|uniref:Uncharacterized protein n=1 Tax=Helicobacter pylori SouthAfrica20 TaxID=1352356 RepID=T1U9B9_HELPX|nr:hypothetical protein HPSA20_0744 [Helicobacter pylori SouthAfrica20]